MRALSTGKAVQTDPTASVAMPKPWSDIKHSRTAASDTLFDQERTTRQVVKENRAS